MTTSVESARVLDELLWTDDGAVFDLRDGRQLAIVRSAGGSALLRVGGRPLVVQEDLRDLSARDLRTGEVVWRKAMKGWVGGLTPVFAGDKALVGMHAVAKWGDGGRMLLDPANGEFVDEGALGPRFVREKGQGRYYGSAAHRGHYATTEGDATRLHSSSDGAVLGRLALSSERSPSTTVLTPDGHTVTSFAFDFRAPREMYFGDSECLVASGTRLVRFDYEGRPLGAASLADNMSVEGAVWHNNGWNLFVHERSPTRKRTILRLGPGALSVLWEDCGAIALLGGEIVTRALEVISLETRRVRVTLARPAAPQRTERTPGRILVDEELVTLLAKLRASSAEKRPAGLSLAELRPVELALGRELPSWALAMLAAQLRCLSTGLSFDRTTIEANTAELQSLLREEKPEMSSLGLVALGRFVAHKGSKRASMVWYERVDTHWWCVDGDKCVLLARLVFDEFVPHTTTSTKRTIEWERRGEREPREMLLPMLEQQRKKSVTRLGGAARQAELEAAAVASLRELSLLE